MDSSCVFCNMANFKERIVAESDDYFIVATLGQITNGGHLLLIPKYHVSCIGEMTIEQAYAMSKAVKDVYLLLSLANGLIYKEKKPDRIITFEHGRAGQSIGHAHIHFLPAQIDLTSRIRDDFPDAEIEEMQNHLELIEKQKENRRRYLFWTTPSGKAMVCWEPGAPPQYMRTISSDALGRPERGDWHNIDAELDKALYSETVTCLRSWFMQCNWTV